MGYDKSRVTIYEVAQMSGVSLATVSRVINNSDTVKEETKRKVMSVIRKLGYKPSGLAQALATNKTTNIGLIIPSANYVYLSNLLNGICEVCKAKGFSLEVFTTSHSREDATNCLEKAIKEKTKLQVILDGTAGLGTSFLEESFGGLIRNDGFKYDVIMQTIEFVSDEDDEYIEEINEYLKAAYEQKNN